MGVDPVKEPPVEAGVSPVKVTIIEPGHAIADHIAGEPAGGGKARHRRFKPSRVREEGFMRGAEDGAGHVGEMREEVRVADWWRWL